MFKLLMKIFPTLINLFYKLNVFYKEFLTICFSLCSNVKKFKGTTHKMLSHILAIKIKSDSFKKMIMIKEIIFLINLILLKNSFSSILFKLILNLIIIIIFRVLIFDLPIVYAAYPFDTWSAAYQIDNPPDLENAGELQEYYLPKKKVDTAAILASEKIDTEALLATKKKSKYTISARV